MNRIENLKKYSDEIFLSFVNIHSNQFQISVSFRLTFATKKPKKMQTRIKRHIFKLFNLNSYY